MSPRFHITGAHGGPVHPIRIRRDRVTPTRIFYRGPVMASLTHEEALALADSLVDLVETSTEEATDGPL